MESNILLYTSDNGDVSIQVRYEDGTFWLTQKRMAELFNVNISTINEHLKSIFSTGELSEEGTIRKFRIVQNEGTRQVAREVAFYPLNAIIALGYRVKSEEATRFRKWATKVLDSFITKGYVLDKNRLKQGEQFGHDYFKDLLRIFVRYVPARGAFIRRLQTFMHCRLTTTSKHQRQNVSLHRCRTSCIGLFQGKRQPKLSMKRPMPICPKWD